MDPLPVSASVAGLVSLADTVFQGIFKCVKGRQGRKKGNRNPIRRRHDSLRHPDKPPPGYRPSGRRCAHIGGKDSSHLRMPTDIGKDQRQACTAYPRHQPHHQRLLLGAGQNQITMAVLETGGRQINKSCRTAQGHIDISLNCR